MSNRSLKQKQNATRFMLLLIVSLLTLVGCENQMGTQRGVISGQILDTDGHRVVGALVTSHRSLFKAETDKNGNFEFTSLDVGSHRLKVERNGYFLASKTIEIEYGQVLSGVKIVVEPVDDQIIWRLINRTSTSVLIDLSCAEDMSVWVGWREKTNARQQTTPTETGKSHQILLENLWPGSDYIFEVEGVTKDGRRYVANNGAFRTVPRGDIPGDPDMPGSFRVSQGNQGVVLNWRYNGADPLEGFRIFRAVESNDLELVQDENHIFADQQTWTDENVDAGQLYRYAIKAVDLDGNLSESTERLAILTSGKVATNLVWRREWSPITISGDITVLAGTTLRIEPGVTIRFNEMDLSQSGYSPLTCEFIVEGTLIADASNAEPIQFISASSQPTRSDWAGIRLISAATQAASELKNVVVVGAETALSVYDGETQIEDLTMRFCNRGLSLQGSDEVAIVGLVAQDCAVGIYAENSLNCTLESINISDVNSGIILRGNRNIRLSSIELRRAVEVGVSVADKEGTLIRNALVQSEKTGLVAGGNEGNYQYMTIDARNGIIVESAHLPVITNNIIVNTADPETGYGIEDMSSGRSYPYNNIHNFLWPTFNCDQDGGPILNADPLFYGGSWHDYNYRLRPGSPLMTASNRNTQPGAYGSSVD